MNRNKEIIKTSRVGIGGNIILSVFKFFVGVIANSVSIKADAMNNLTDALSSVITIVGTKLSEREPDRKHPFGYGRIEYLTSLFIGIIILYAGFGAIRESLQRIIHPEASDFSKAAIIIVAAGVAVKVALGIYTKKKGKKLSSASLIASGQDSIDDSIASLGTLVAAIVYVLKGVNIEAYIGLIISGLIIKTGIETLRDTISSILGERVDEDKATAVRKSIMSFPEVDGVFDIVIHNYGNEKLVGSAHIEVPDVLTAAWIDNLQRAITARVLNETGVELMGLTIYAVNSKDKEAIAVQESIRKIAEDDRDVIGMHGFYIDKIDREIKFDIVTDFDLKNTAELKQRIESKVSELYPGYTISIVMKKDFSD